MLAAEVCTHAQSPRRKEEEGKLPSYIVVLCHLLDVCQLWGKPLLPSSSSSPLPAHLFSANLLLRLRRRSHFQTPPPSPSPSRAFSLPHHGDTAAQNCSFLLLS